MSRLGRMPRALAACLLLAAAAPAQEAPKVAGVDVPPPKRSRFTMPEYPAEAQGKGIRGIVILEILIDTQGHVASAEVVRSIPGLDEAALAAVRRWEYEVTRVDGKPVSVRLTVPITFAMKLPELTRQQGIPELRQGAIPQFPQAATSREVVSVVAEVTLEADGRVAEIRLKSGEAPWSQALIQALRTWRFAPPEQQGVELAFRVEAAFVPAAKGGQPRVDLRLSGLQRTEALASVATPEPPSSVAGPAPSPGPAPTPAPAETPAPPPSPTPVSAATPAPASPAPVPRPVPPRPPVTEALTAPAPGAPQGTPSPAPLGESVSSVAGVALEVGVPDLVRGRRPLVPPLARMAGESSGSVEVRFSVDGAGQTTVLAVEGPDLYKTAASQTVSSWIFRRASVERLRLLAVFSYGSATATAVVRPLAETPATEAPK